MFKVCVVGLQVESGPWSMAYCAVHVDESLICMLEARNRPLGLCIQCFVEFEASVQHENRIYS